MSFFKKLFKGGKWEQIADDVDLSSDRDPYANAAWAVPKGPTEMVLDTILPTDESVPEELRGCQVVEQRYADGTTKVVYRASDGFCVDEGGAEVLIKAHRLEREAIRSKAGEKTGGGKVGGGGWNQPVSSGSQPSVRAKTVEPGLRQPVKTVPPVLASAPPPRARPKSKVATSSAQPKTTAPSASFQAQVPQGGLPQGGGAPSPSFGEVLDQFPMDKTVPKKLRGALLVRQKGKVFYLTAVGKKVSKEEAEDWMEVWEKSNAIGKGASKPNRVAQTGDTEAGNAPLSEKVNDAWGFDAPATIKEEDSWERAFAKAELKNAAPLDDDGAKAAFSKDPQHDRRQGETSPTAKASPASQVAPAAGGVAATPRPQADQVRPAEPQPKRDAAPRDLVPPPNAGQPQARQASVVPTRAATPAPRYPAMVTQDSSRRSAVSSTNIAPSAASHPEYGARQAEKEKHASPDLNFRRLLRAAEALRSRALKGELRLRDEVLRGEEVIAILEEAVFERLRDERVERMIKHSMEAQKTLSETWKGYVKGVDRSVSADLNSGRQVALVLDAGRIEDLDVGKLLSLTVLRSVERKRQALFKDIARRFKASCVTDLTNYIMTKSFLDEWNWKLGSEEEMVAHGVVREKVARQILHSLTAIRLHDSLLEVLTTVSRRHGLPLMFLKTPLEKIVERVTHDIADKLIVLSRA